jgi:hypothetical protein
MILQVLLQFVGPALNNLAEQEVNHQYLLKVFWHNEDRERVLRR